jgi:NAD(P)-dependent dehydrogenase (short-subunit alcohol dehydrogenase family)
MRRQGGSRQQRKSEMPFGRQVIVTGGARGIGFGIATAMLKAGYDVTATGLSAEEVAAVPQNKHLSAVRLDVTCPESIAGCAGAVRRTCRAG